MTKQITLSELVKICGGTVKGNPDTVITGVNSLKDAKPGDNSFLGNKKYVSQLEKSKAGAVIVTEDLVKELSPETAAVICDNPDLVFSKAIMIFAPEAIKHAPGIHPSAVVAADAVIAPTAAICANAVIEPGAVIGENTVIGSGSYVGHYTKIGANCLIYPNVTIRERCVIGNRVILHPSTVIGSDGFGFVPGPRGIIKIPQVGIVQIDDDVEIGSACTVDRARFGKTWIKTGVKIDNLVQIAHNVIVGEFSLIVAQAGVAGSAEIGRGVIIAAKGGINGHIQIGDGSKVAGTSGVVKSLPPGSTVVGTPAEPEREFVERLALPKKVRRLSDKIAALEEELLKLKASISK